MSLDVKGGIDREFCIWLAGFWEGEGWVSIINRKDRSRKHFVVAVSQCNKSLMEHIKNTLGVGHVYLRSESKLSKKDCWTWVVYSVRQVEFVLRLIRPYLRFRSTEVDEVLTEIEKVKSHVITHSQYSPDEVQFIRANYLEKSDKYIGDKLGRGREAIRDKRHSLGLMKFQGWKPRC